MTQKTSTGAYWFYRQGIWFQGIWFQGISKAYGSKAQRFKWNGTGLRPLRRIAGRRSNLCTSPIFSCCDGAMPAGSTPAPLFLMLCPHPISPWRCWVWGAGGTQPFLHGRTGGSTGVGSTHTVQQLCHQSMTRQRVRLERDAPAGALRLPTVSVEKRSGTVVSFLKSANARQCLQTW